MNAMGIDMHPLKTLTLVASVILIAGATAGCAGTKPARYADLASSGQLHPNELDRSGRIPFRYPGRTDWSPYRRAIVEPVVIYPGSDAQFEDISDADKNELARFMQAEFSRELAARFELVRDAGPGTIRLHLTLTGAETTARFIAPVLRFDLVGAPYNIVQSIRGKEGALSGWVMYAVEVYDAQTNRLLDAYVAKQYPNAMNVAANLGSLNAAKTGISKGAEELVRAFR